MSDDDNEIDSKHDLAHELAERLLSCIDSFVAEKGKQTCTLPVVLMATEIPASVSRRLCRDAGMKESVKGIQAQAAQCAVPYYEDRAATSKSKKLDATLMGFIINPGDEYPH
jgi:hypothetical protein